MSASPSMPRPPGVKAVKGNTLEPAAWSGPSGPPEPSEVAGTLEPAAAAALGVTAGNGPGLGMPG
eukprot:159779-Alexandrium_andersonii.AAC.1